MVKKQMYTSMVDLDAYARTDWVYVGCLKTEEEYAGIANALRHAGIDYSLKDKGSLRENNIFAAIFFSSKYDKNYGMDLFVPAGMEKRACKTLKDDAALRIAADRQADEGKAYQAAFEEAASRARAAALGRNDNRASWERKLNVPNRPYSKPTGRIVRPPIDSSSKANGDSSSARGTSDSQPRQRAMRFAKIAIAVLALVLTFTGFAFFR